MAREVGGTPRGTRLGVVMVALAAASWGCWSLFLRPAGLPPSITTPLMFLVMGLAALPFALAAPRVAWSRRVIVLVGAYAVFDALNILTFFGAIDTTTVAIAVLCHYAAPILIALLAPFIEGVRTPGARPAAVVALLGLVIVLEPWSTAVHGALPGAALGFASALCYVGNAFTLRRLTLQIGAPRAMSYHSFVSAVLTAPLLLLAPAGVITARGVALIVISAATLGSLAGVVYAIGLARIGAARAAVLTFAEPLVAVAVGVLAWHESIHVTAALGGAVVLGAGIYVARQSA